MRVVPLLAALLPLAQAAWYTQCPSTTTASLTATDRACSACLAPASACPPTCCLAPAGVCGASCCARRVQGIRAGSHYLVSAPAGACGGGCARCAAAFVDGAPLDCPSGIDVPDAVDSAPVQCSRFGKPAGPGPDDDDLSSSANAPPAATTPAPPAPPAPAPPAPAAPPTQPPAQPPTQPPTQPPAAAPETPPPAAGTQAPAGADESTAAPATAAPGDARAAAAGEPVATPTPGSADPSDDASGGAGEDASGADGSGGDAAGTGTPSTTAVDDGPACFPGDAVVSVRGRGDVRMRELRVGDAVLSARGEYSAVFGFTHRAPAAAHVFVRIATDSGRVLRASAGHYLYVGGVLRPAGDVRVGDVLGGGTVVGVGTVRGVGLYNPQTLHGGVVVDGVECSTYTTAVDPEIAHAALAPVRAVYRAFRWRLDGLLSGELARTFVLGVAPAGGKFVV